VRACGAASRAGGLGAGRPQRLQRLRPGARRQAARKVLRLALVSAETSFDPPQTNSDANTVTILANILEAPLTLRLSSRARCALEPCTAAALPEISADGRTITVRIRAGIHFADDPAFKGRRRELTAHDYVYSIKRFYDPQYNSGDLYLFENAKLPGLAALREAALKSRRPFDYDTEVEGVRALDRHTFRIVLGDANPRLARLRAGRPGPVRRGGARGGGALRPAPSAATTVGTGAPPPEALAPRLADRAGALARLPRRPLPGRARPTARWRASIAARLAGRALPLVDEIVLDVVEEAQPRFGCPSWTAPTTGWPRPRSSPALAAPQGRLAPLPAEEGGDAAARALDPFMRMSYFYMGDPVVAATRAEGGAPGTPSPWPSTPRPPCGASGRAGDPWPQCASSRPSPRATTPAYRAARSARTTRHARRRCSICAAPWTATATAGARPADGRPLCCAWPVPAASAPG
jgi:hypothetical protein